MSQERFHLEIYEPGSRDTVLGSWRCTAPVHVASGEVLRLGALVPDALPSYALRAVAVEHVMWIKDGALAHKLMVFTEPVA